MKFALGARSLAELQGVHQYLIAVVHRAIEITLVDFAVHDGMRTVQEQRALVDSGASQTMNSRHLTGHAVDLVPFINGKLRWEWGPIHHIADAVRTAAKELKVPLVWGGCWDIDFTESTGHPDLLVKQYVARRKEQRKRAFLDGPHFELPRNLYP